MRLGESVFEVACRSKHDRIFAIQIRSILDERDEEQGVILHESSVLRYGRNSHFAGRGDGGNP